MSKGRWIRRAAVVCAVGLVVNAAVTYVLATLVPFSQDFQAANISADAPWRGVFAGLPEPTGAFESSNAAITYWQVLHEAEVAAPPRKWNYVLHVHRLGFPLRCVQGQSAYIGRGPSRPAWSADILWRSPWFMRPGRAYLALMPLRPLWWGVAGNAVAYGVVAIGCGALWRRGVSARRKRRGLCPRCAYPVSGAVCSECGTAVAPGS